MDFKGTLIRFFNSIMKMIINIIPEIALITGAFFIIFAFFLMNKIAGYFALGVFLNILGWFLAKTRK